MLQGGGGDRCGQVRTKHAREVDEVEGEGWGWDGGERGRRDLGKREARERG
jgi:hypothetical protein